MAEKQVKQQDVSEIQTQALSPAQGYVHLRSGTQDSETLGQILAAPFDPEFISWKPGATTRDKSRAVGFAYVDPRHYYDRLNAAFGFDWSDQYDIQFERDKVVVKCGIRLMTVTHNTVVRSDFGEEPFGSGDRDNSVTTASAQAFKRACVKFGVGAHLYRIPQVWADYDEQKRRFSTEGLRKLDAASYRNYFEESALVFKFDPERVKDAGSWAEKQNNHLAWKTAVERLKQPKSGE